MKRFRATLLAVLFLSAAYLYAWPTATIAYESSVLLHLLAGVVFAIFCAPYIFRKMFIDGSAEGRVGWHLFAVGLILGIVLIFTGTPRAYLPILYAHIFICTAAGVILVSAWLRRKDWHFTPPPLTPLATYLGVAAAAVAICAGAWWLRTQPWARANRILNPPIAPATMDAEGDGPSGPFFPSSAQTEKERKIAAGYFMESDTCQRCHADIYKQWNSSAHHFSSFNNQWYRKSIEYMQDVRGITPSKWCAGCHDPALLFSGEFDRPVREVEKLPEGQAGLGGMMCHSAAHVKTTIGQDDINLEVPRDT